MTFATIDFLLAGCFLAGILINPSTCRPNGAKCLMYLDEVREILGSKIPPINDSRMTDNYYNISRAFYPSVNLPALYVRVTIQFLKDYQNGTKMIDDQKKNLKFTWSKACSYVSGISLDEMSVFSLFTIYPQRRESELVMTVPPFCDSSPYAIDDDTMSKTWKYVVSTLEDIIVNPKTSDPRLNTAGCVIIGQEGDVADYEYPDLWYFYWFILVSSFLASFSLWILLLQYVIDGMKRNLTENKRFVSGAALKMTGLTTLMFLATAISVPTLIALKSEANGEMFVYFGVYIGLELFAFVIGCCWNRSYIWNCECNSYIWKCSRKNAKCNFYWFGSYFLFPCLFQTVHHFLWVVCGIISEPFWAIPIFLLECLFAGSFLFALFIYEKGFKDSSEASPSASQECNLGNEECKAKKTPNDAFVVFHLVVSLVSFVLVLVTIALIAVSNGNAVNSPTAGAIEGVMTGILFWLIKNSSLDFWMEGKKQNVSS